MIKGLDSFRNWFRGYEDNYTIIGGTACDLLMSEAGINFRATKDIDMVLIVEALSADFGLRFWEYIKEANYEHRRRGTDMPEFYRFSRPKSAEYPAMIELFSRRVDGISLPPDSVLTPLPIESDISSLSAILLDDEYYEFLKSGMIVVEGVSILDASHLIPFKAKAWLDLTRRKQGGEHMDSKNISKHMKDVQRLSDLFTSEDRLDLPRSIAGDIRRFLLESNVDADKAGRIAKLFGLRN